MSQEGEPTAPSPLEIICDNGLEYHLSMLMEGGQPMLPDKKTIATSVEELVAYCQRRDTSPDPSQA